MACAHSSGYALSAERPVGERVPTESLWLPYGLAAAPQSTRCGGRSDNCDWPRRVPEPVE